MFLIDKENNKLRKRIEDASPIGLAQIIHHQF